MILLSSEKNDLILKRGSQAKEHFFFTPFVLKGHTFEVYTLRPYDFKYVPLWQVNGRKDMMRN